RDQPKITCGIFCVFTREPTVAPHDFLAGKWFADYPSAAMKPVEAMVLLMCAVVAVVMLGRRLGISYPIALVLGGLGIALVPGLPVVQLDPDLVLLLFLPPLLYATAWFTSWHEFKANLRPIVLLAVGLVLFTTIVVGVVVHALVPTMPLAIAF